MLTLLQEQCIRSPTINGTKVSPLNPNFLNNLSNKNVTLDIYPVVSSIDIHKNNPTLLYYKENKNIKTAGTDGKVIHYNPEFLEKLSVEEQAFIFAHEVCHIAFNHIFCSNTI